jgi:putative ABC transport system permease protein
MLGDQLMVTVESERAGVRVDVPLRIVGEFDLFPTWYATDGPLFVGNLDYVFQQAGGDFPYHVWFDAAPEFRRSQMAAPESLPIALNTPLYPISQTEQQPERQGVFGLLSVGFLGTALLSTIGFLLHVVHSFRQRMIEIGMLRAMGLSMRQLVVMLITELAFIILIGVGIGTLLGVVASMIFIPYLQVGGSVPPFTVEIAWSAVLRVYVLFAWLFAIALIVLAILLRQIKIAQIIKLGETV